MDLQAMVQAYRDLGLASKMTSKAESLLCQQLAELLKQHLKSECVEFVTRQQSTSLLYSYSFDATRTMITQTTKERTAAGTIQRGGRQAVELLMQRILLRGTDTISPDHMRHLFMEPVPMTAGHSQWYVFAAACDALPLARTMGHQGFLVYHVVADRAQLSSLARLLQARQEAWHHANLQPESGGALDASLSYLRDMFISCGCALHDIQNGLRWSVHPLLHGEILKDCHIVLEALRNTSTTLMSCLPQHLATRCVARAAPELEEEVCRQFWSLLGVDATMLDLLVQVDPWFDGSLVRVNPGTLETGGEDPYLLCSQCALYLMRWRRFTESRFMSMGTASQGLLGSLAVGLTALVQDAQGLHGASLFHLQGFHRLDKAQKLLMVVLTVVSALTHELLTLVMLDDRLLRQAPDLVQIMEEELTLAHHWPAALWARLATLVDPALEAQQLRMKALDSLHIQAAYVNEKILRVMNTYPWKIGLDVEHDALADLLHTQEEPQDPFTRKLWKLLKAGVSPQQLQDIPALLQQASWSSMAVEQAHGSSATIRRFHPELALDQHLARAYLHQCRHLFTPTEEQQAQEALEKRLCRLQSRRGSVTGRNLFFKDLVAQTRQSLGGGSLSKDALKQLMLRHVAYYNALSPEEQHVYERQAVIASQQKRSSLQSDQEHECAHERLQKARRLELLRRTGGLGNSASVAKLSESATQRLHTAHTSVEFTSQGLRALRDAACKAPQPPSTEVQRHFQQVSDTLPVKTKTEPGLWVKQLCEHREHFAGLTIAESLEPNTKAYKFCYAVQNPRLVVFQVMTVVHTEEPPKSQVATTNLADLADSTARHRFHLLPGTYCSHHDVHFHDNDELLAVPDTFYGDGFHLQSFANAVPLETLLAEYPHKHRHTNATEPGARRTAGAEVSEEDLIAHPWLQQLRSEPATRSSRTMPSGSTGRASASTSKQQILDLDETEVQRAWEELREAREKWSTNVGLGVQDFSITLRGGAWTKQHRGVAADAVLASAVTEDGKAFVACYGEPRSASYSILAYDNVATVLAVEWCARHQHYLNLWVSRGRGHQTFSQADAACILFQR